MEHDESASPDPTPSGTDAPGTEPPGTEPPGTVPPGVPQGAVPQGDSPAVTAAEGGADSPPGTGPPGTGPPGTGPPGTGPPGTGPPGPHALQRDMHHRMLGGVAAGLARYLDIDVVIVRIIAVALAFLGGSGVLLYVAAWLLMPSDESGRAVAQDWAGRRPARRSIVVAVLGAVLGVIALSDLFSSGPWWPHDKGGFGFGAAIVALALAVVLLAGSGTNRTAASRVRWFVKTVVVACAAVIVVAAATVLTVEAVSGVPLRGGIGNSQWAPTTAAQLKPSYRLAIGNLTVDLAQVSLRPGTTHVTASVGVGRLVVEIPSGPRVSVDAHSELGNVVVFGRQNSGLATVQTMTTNGSGSGNGTGNSSGNGAVTGTGGAGGKTLVVDADVGVGQVQVVRTPPAWASETSAAAPSASASA